MEGADGRSKVYKRGAVYRFTREGLFIGLQKGGCL